MLLDVTNASFDASFVVMDPASLPLAVDRDDDRCSERLAGLEREVRADQT